MAQQIEQLPLNIKHGHDGQRVLCIFGRSIDNLQLTPEQVKDFIDGLEGSLEKLLEHKAKPKN